MEYNKQILEAIQRGVQLALDDYEDDNSKLTTKRNIVNNRNTIADNLFFYHPIEKIKDLSITPKEYKEFEDYVKTHNMKYIVKDNQELADIVEYFRRKSVGPQCNLNWIDTSNVTNMAYLFADCDFNGNISEWDTSNVITMANMFQNAPNFNGDISKWNVSNVISMNKMFLYARNFNQDISNWDVSHVKITSAMFYNAKSFNQDLSKWKLMRVLNDHRRYMFDMSGMDANTGNQLTAKKNKKKQPKEYSDFEVNAQLAIDREMEGK